MKLEKIKINITFPSDPQDRVLYNKKTSALKHYFDIALLVDNIAFLQRLSETRENLRINHIYSLEAGPMAFYKDAELFNENIYNDVITSVRTLRKEFNRLQNFDRVILHALICNVVPSDVYMTCYLDEMKLINPEYEDNEHSAIILTPETTEADLLKVFREYKKGVKEYMKTIRQGKKPSTLLSYKFDTTTLFPEVDTLSKIERLRDDYWLVYEQVINRTGHRRGFKEIETLLNEVDPFRLDTLDQTLFTRDIRKYYNMCNKRDHLVRY